jgi:hypothetical protein
VAKVKFECAEDVNRVESARADGSLLAIESGKPYETDDEHEIALLDSLEGVNRVAVKKGS